MFFRMRDGTPAVLKTGQKFDKGAESDTHLHNLRHNIKHNAMFPLENLDI